jgi:hypothetical protein
MVTGAEVQGTAAGDVPDGGRSAENVRGTGRPALDLVARGGRGARRGVVQCYRLEWVAARRSDSAVGQHEARLACAGSISSHESRSGSGRRRVRGSVASVLECLTKRVGALQIMGIVKPGSGRVRVRLSSRATMGRGRFGTTKERRGWALVAPCPTMNALFALWPRICDCSC